MRLADLEAADVAIWGAGREGRAAWQVLRQRFPEKALALICAPSEQAAATAFVDARTRVLAQEATAQLLTQYQIVVKSPGVSPYRSPLPEAAAAGVRFVSGTAIWFAERPQARTIAITGSKGKSTTSAMVAHLLRAAGRRTVLAGNIGMPLLSLLDAEPAADWWVLELSSFQTRDMDAVPEIGVVLNLFPEHLDWHLSVAAYYRDKMRLLGNRESHPRVSVINAMQAYPAECVPVHGVQRFGDDTGFHLRAGSIFHGGQRVLAREDLPLPGGHNALNFCAALTVVDAAGEDAIALAPSIGNFQPLPHRLQLLGRRDGLDWVNDSIATTPHATLAALSHYAGRPVALLLGGHDRGVSWSEFATAISASPPAVIITMGAAGERIQAALAGLDRAHCSLLTARDLADAVTQARRLLPPAGVVLLSPGAPSFGEFRDYVERGRRFAGLVGFDPTAIASIEGLGG